MSSSLRTIRSYQRVFRPDRRIYSIDGRPIPVPGGVPLRWLGWAAGALVVVLLLAAGSPLVLAGSAAAAGLAGFALRGSLASVCAAVVAVALAYLTGLVLSLLGWPLRLLIVPGLVATLATQATADGRPAHRYALSWLAVRLGRGRRSLGRPLPDAGRTHSVDAKVRVAPDEHSSRLRRALVCGPALVSFARPVSVRRRRVRRRLVVRPIDRSRPRGGAVVDSLEIGPRELAELRP